MMKKMLFAPALVFAFISLYSQESLTGNVTDAKSNPIPGASVYILNNNYGTITDAQGKFRLTGLKAGTYIVSISAVGFSGKTEEIITPLKKDFNITLVEANIHLDEVIVSAQKREEVLQKLPLSVSVFSSSKVRDYRLWRNKDISVIVPNLYSANPGDDRNVTSVRGITSTSYDPAVATYVDGVNQFSLDTYIPQLFDVERIEILRGPQGTLYGRNAMGGVINIITKQPTNETSGFAEINFGNYNQQRYTAAIRTPVIKDKLFFGASLMYNSFDGFYTNDYNNSKFDKQHSLTGNYYLKWLASQNWAVTLNVKHHDNRNNGPFSLVNGADEAIKNPFHLNQNATTQMVDNTFNASLSVNYTGPSFNFSSQSSWQTNYRYYKQPIDGDFSPIDGVTIINNYGRKWNNVKAFTQEFRFSSPSSLSSPWKWTTGIYMFYQDVPNKQATRFGNDADLLGVPDKNFSTIATSTGKSTGAAFFGQVSYEVNNRVQLTAGIRYDYEHKKQDVLGQYQHDPDPNPMFDTRPDTSASANFNAFSPSVTANYLITKNNTVYFTYSRGFRAGGFTQLSSDPSQPPLFKFKPEYSNSYEIGTKNEFLNNRFRLNAAFFYTTVNDAQVPTLVLPDAVTITKNAGTLHSEGIEIEMAATPVKNLEFSYNFGYTRAKYKTLKLSQNGSEVNLEGNRQVYTPITTSALAAQYNYPLGTDQKLRLVIRGEWLNTGSEFFDLANTIRQSDYSLFNARLGVAAKNFEVMLWGRNLSDKKYIAYAYDFGAVHLGDPRTYGVTLVGKF